MALNISKQDYICHHHFFFFLMESKSFRECPKSTLMSLSANVSIGTFTLAKYKCVMPPSSALCIRNRQLHIRYSPWPSANPCQGGRRWLEVFGANVSFPTLPLPGGSLSAKLMWMLFPAWVNLWTPSYEFYSIKTDSQCMSILYILRVRYNLNFTFGLLMKKLDKHWALAPCWWHFLPLISGYGLYVLVAVQFLSISILHFYVFNKVMKVILCQLVIINEGLQCCRKMIIINK